MSTKHTPGPWTADQRDATHLNVHAQGTHIAAVVRHAPTNPEQRTTGSNEAGEANARLIAAAPELLDALRECLPILEAMDHGKDPDDEDMPLIAQVQAAIAKATL